MGGARMREDGSVEPPDLRLMEINLLGVMNTVHLALGTSFPSQEEQDVDARAAYFRANEPDANGFRGRIVAAASTAGIYPFPHESLYGSSKHGKAFSSSPPQNENRDHRAGVVGLVRALATSLKPEGITINALAPSLVGRCCSTKKKRKQADEEQRRTLGTRRRSTPFAPRDSSRPCPPSCALSRSSRPLTAG